MAPFRINGAASGSARPPCTGAPARTALVLLTCITFASCSQEEPYFQETFVMGTAASVTICGLDEEQAREAAASALHELHRIESIMSSWKEDSELSRLNRLSRGNRFRVSAELFVLVDSALHFSMVTSGAFDITAGPVIRLWGFHGGDVRLPTENEIDEALSRVGYRRVTLDAGDSSITLEPGMELDLGGIAKGYAVDRAVSLLREKGATSALVNLGGNIYALGTPPGKDGWSVGIRDPHGGAAITGTILLRDEAVATSGNYENFVVIGEKRYGHIVDPRTGRPVDRVLSVTVVAPTALATDALSTGLFVLGPDGGRDIVDRPGCIRALYALPGNGAARYKAIGDFEGRLSLTE